MFFERTINIGPAALKSSDRISLDVGEAWRVGAAGHVLTSAAAYRSGSDFEVAVLGERTISFIWLSDQPLAPGAYLLALVAADTPGPASPARVAGLNSTSRAAIAAAVGSWQVLAPPDPDREGFTVSNTVAGSTLLVAESAQAPTGADYTVVPALSSYTFPAPPKGRLWINESVGTAGDGFGARDIWRRSPLLPPAASMAYPASGRMGVLSGFRGAGAQQSVRRYNRNGVLDLRDLYVDLPNWVVTSAGLETANANDIVVFAALEYPVGTTPQPFALDASYAAISGAAPASAYGSTAGIYIPAGQTARARLPGSYLPAQGVYMIHLWAAPRPTQR